MARAGWIAGVALLAAPVGAQQHDPTRLPGDHPPPPLSVMLQPMAPGGPPPVGPDVPGPSLEESLSLARAAMQICATKGYRMGASVIDSAGNIRVALTMPGSGPGRAFTATQKALGALRLGMPTRLARQRLRDDAALRARVTPNMAVFPGGVPILRGGVIIGALALSGATAEEDDACAATALAGAHP
ncbi:GlcG/HbpS family heme-binding protein [Novosphingobium terrae]|uniref:GlcG/HbpS family heme-binding protein n=1 Tax=Novosphingobium terrae TaxID=2726189 RepID=UPI00197D73B6|nr:heme-binding protein [Novosphingobium terrae]